MSAAALPKIAVILGGKNGMLGQALTKALASAGVRPVPVSGADVDYLDADALEDFLDELQPDDEEDTADLCLINTVAYTQVDLAEDQPEEAYKLNAALPAQLGIIAMERGHRLVHFSTDFVFDGAKNAPYLPADAANPLSVYGASKLAGEEALLSLDVPGLLLLRTAWLFGPGKVNFVARMIELASQRPELNVVNDQHGSPTCTTDLAGLTVALLKNGATGLLHAANSGQATWFELATEAIRLAGPSCRVNPIPTSGYPTKAKRPPCSVLDISETAKRAGYMPRDWREALAEYVAQLPPPARGDSPQSA
ncbi:MAG: dTDP-4-dehydrorhamnose reductase [Desulfovibrionaceae bacterium CG1_02_65_16]|nr:MAG: dTDP-4-dehydrorhamnose reductase [Desulfovibrionaceae bacterium CG1_02_65_16]